MEKMEEKKKWKNYSKRINHMARLSTSTKTTTFRHQSQYILTKWHFRLAVGKLTSKNVETNVKMFVSAIVWFGWSILFGFGSLGRQIPKKKKALIVCAHVSVWVCACMAVHHRFVSVMTFFWYCFRCFSLFDILWPVKRITSFVPSAYRSCIDFIRIQYNQVVLLLSKRCQKKKKKRSRHLTWMPNCPCLVIWFFRLYSFPLK